MANRGRDEFRGLVAFRDEMGRVRRIQNINRREGVFCDFTFQVEGTYFPVHRIILASEALYFDQFFQHDLRRDFYEMPLESGITADAFEDFLTFLYTRYITLETDNLANIHRAAEYFRYNKLIKFITRFIVAQPPNRRQGIVHDIPIYYYSDDY